MPQPKAAKKAPARKGTTAKRATAAKRSSPAKRSTTTKRATAAKRSSPAKRSTTKRATAKKSTTAAKRSTAARRSANSPEEIIRANVKAFRDALGKGPFHLLMLTRDRIQEALDDAVDRGRITRTDANHLAADLVKRGRKQTEDVLSDLEQLLGRGRDLRSRAEKAGRESADRVLREVDRARRRTGVGNSFPILGYDDLSAGQVTARLGDLTPAQLRKVRDYERRNGNRKSVLNAIEKKLG